MATTRDVFELLLRTVYDGSGLQGAAQGAAQAQAGFDRLTGQSLRAALQMQAAEAQTDMLRKRLAELSTEVARGNITIDRAEKEYDELRRSMQRIEPPRLTPDVPNVSPHQQAIQGLIGTLGTLAATYLTVQTAQKAWEEAKAGDAALRTEARFAALIESVGGTVDALEALKEATRREVDETTLLAGANTILQMGLAGSAAELEKHLFLITRLKKPHEELGQAIDAWALMLANLSIERLDSFGISSGRVRARIEELQQANAGMSRETAFTTAVLEQAQAAVERLGPEVTEARDEFAALEATTGNLRTAFQTGLAQGLRPFVEYLNEADVSALEEGLARIGEFAGKELAGFARDLDKGIFTDVDMLSMTRQIWEAQGALKELGYTYRQAREILGESPAGDFWSGRDRSGALEAQIERVERARVVTELLAAGMTRFQAGDFVARMDEAGQAATGFAVSADVVAEALRNPALSGNPLNDVVLAMQQVASSGIEVTEVTGGVLAALQGTGEAAGWAGARSEALQVALILMAAGYQESEAAIIRQTTALLNSEDPIGNALRLAEQVAAGEISKAAATEDATVATVQQTTAVAGLSSELAQQYMALLRSSGAMSEAEEAAIRKALQDGRSTEEIGRMIAALGILTPAQHDLVLATLDLITQRDNLSASDLNYLANLGNLTQQIDENSAALLRNAQAERERQAARDQVQAWADSFDPARPSFVSRFEMTPQEQEAAERLLRTQEQIARAADRVNRAGDGIGGSGRAAREAATDMRVFADALADAGEEVSRIEEDTRRQLRSLGERTEEQIEQIEDRVARAQQALADAWAAAVGQFNRAQASEFLSFIDELSQAEPPSMEVLFQQLLDGFMRAKAAAGDTAENIHQVAEGAGLVNAETLAAAARLQQFADAYESLARADLTPEQEIAAISALQEQWLAGEEANLDAYGVKIQDANAFAVEQTRERAEEVAAIERAAAEDRITILQGAQEEARQIMERGDEQIAGIVERTIDRIQQAFGRSFTSAGELEQAILDVGGAALALPAEVEIVLRYVYETEGSPPPEAAGWTPQVGNATPRSPANGSPGGAPPVGGPSDGYRPDAYAPATVGRAQGAATGFGPAAMSTPSPAAEMAVVLRTVYETDGAPPTLPADAEAVLRTVYETEGAPPALPADAEAVLRTVYETDGAPPTLPADAEAVLRTVYETDGAPPTLPADAEAVLRTVYETDGAPPTLPADAEAVLRTVYETDGAPPTLPADAEAVLRTVYETEGAPAALPADAEAVLRTVYETDGAPPTLPADAEAVLRTVYETDGAPPTLPADAEAVLRTVYETDGAPPALPADAEAVLRTVYEAGMTGQLSAGDSGLMAAGEFGLTGFVGGQPVDRSVLSADAAFVLRYVTDAVGSDAPAHAARLERGVDGRAAGDRPPPGSPVLPDSIAQALRVVTGMATPWLPAEDWAIDGLVFVADRRSSDGEAADYGKESAFGPGGSTLVSATEWSPAGGYGSSGHAGGGQASAGSVDRPNGGIINVYVGDIVVPPNTSPEQARQVVAAGLRQALQMRGLGRG